MCLYFLNCTNKIKQFKMVTQDEQLSMAAIQRFSKVTKKFECKENKMKQ